MSIVRKLSLTSALAAAVVSTVAVWQAWAANDRIQFPENYEDGVHYATVNRGGVREEIFTSLEAITAAKAGQPLPDGTVIMMEDYRGGQLHRYVVMENRPGGRCLSGERPRRGLGISGVRARSVCEHGRERPALHELSPGPGGTGFRVHAGPDAQRALSTLIETHHQQSGTTELPMSVEDRNLENAALQSPERRTVLVGGAALAAVALVGGSAMAQDAAGSDMSCGA